MVTPSIIAEGPLIQEIWRANPWVSTKGMLVGINAGLGAGRFPFRNADNYWRWVALCEQSQLDSIWHSDRILSEHPFVESMSMMAALAGATRRIKFGMNSAVLSFRDPVMLAKQCATIDYISNGRLLPSFGIGGPRVPEFASGAFDGSARGKRANEALEVMSRLWSEDQVDYEGEFFKLSNASINPKPVQKHFPVWIGGNSAAAQMRTAKYGTGWLGGLSSVDTVAATVSGIKDALQVTGRHIADDHYGATIVFRFAEPAEKAKVFVPKVFEALSVVGDAHNILSLMNQYTAVGISKFVAIPLADNDEDMILQSQLFIDELLPVLGSL
ncbi:MAG: LLM class flavin-dependent oxidoreductase [Pseudomonadota bacterium]